MTELPPVSLGLTILNSSLEFQVRKSKALGEYLFIVTKSNEILVYIKKEDQINAVSYFDKKYLILPSPQSREEIFDLFIMNKSNEILSQKEQIIITVSASLIVSYYSITDGLCISKVNISAFKEEEIISITSINKRFLLIFFKKKAIVFDTFSQVVFKEEPMKVLNKISEDEEKEDFQQFEINKVYQIKENSFFILSEKDETFFLSVTNIGDFEHLNINYEKCRIRILKQSFSIKKFFNEESMSSTFSNNEFIFYNFNQKIAVGMLDSIEELTELSYVNVKAKFPIIYINRIKIKNEEKLLVLYKDLACEIYVYDKKLREIKLESKFVIMIEDEFINMKYLVCDNVIIGYTETAMNIFDLRRMNKNNEKYVDKVISLSDIFNKGKKKLNFTKYFQANFSDYVKDLTDEMGGDFNITCSAIFSYSENKTIYYIIGTDSGKVALIDIFFQENLAVSPILVIDYHQTPIESFAIYENRILITSSLDGTISFTDINSQKLEAAISTLTINKVEYHDVLAETEMLRRNSIGRKNSLDEYSEQFNYSYVKRRSLRKSSVEFKKNVITLIPNFNIKTFSKLKRILPVETLDHEYKYAPDQKRKIKSLLAFEMENNEVIVYRMDTFASLYRFNQGTSRTEVLAVYHLTYQKVLIFYLSDNSIKISSYSTRTCDRYITNIDTIYKLLQVEDKLHKYFTKPEKVCDYVNGISKNELKFEESDLEDTKTNSDSGYSYSTTRKEINPDEITVTSIKKIITDEKEKELFTKKLFSLAMGQRQKMNSSQNKFEAIFIRAKSKYVIDEMIRIINNNENDKLKKIQIMNLLFNHQFFMKLQDCSDYEKCGISENYLKVGGQYAEFISFNFEEYFNYIEKKIKEQKNISTKFRTNYFNFLSLFHIWNFSLEIDTYLYLQLKLFQPIFDFSPILLGVDSNLSIILTEEANIDVGVDFNYKFSDHFQYFNVYWKDPKRDKQKNKQDLFLNKNLLLESQQGYLVNLKNYKVSQALSHLLHLGLFGSLIALLGFNSNNKFCETIDSLKRLMKVLAVRKEIEYSNFEMFSAFMFDNNEDLTMTNKDLLLNDYLSMEYSNAAKNKNNIEMIIKFKLSVESIMLYLDQVYNYIFNLKGSQDEVYKDFHKLTKDANIEYGNKLDFLSEYELSMINFLITYNSIATHSNDKLNENLMIKITQLLVLYVFKIIKDKNIMKIPFSKNIVELLSISTALLDQIYQSNMGNYANFLLEFYVSCNIPVNLESTIKKFTIGTISIIKSEENPNFLKIILAKLIKDFCKTRISLILKIIVEEFKKKRNDQFIYPYLIEMLWLLFREKNAKRVQYLPTVINLIMTTMSPANKDLKSSCLENSKKVLSCLLLNYPMTSFHQNSQKLAVGANDGKIYIYDMTSGNIWKNLSAHSSEITALTFDISGNIIVSYSSTERKVKCWKIGLTNFFSNLFAAKEGYYKQQTFSEIKEKVSAEDKLSFTKFQTVPNKEHEILLIRENKVVEILKI